MAAMGIGAAFAVRGIDGLAAERGLWYDEYDSGWMHHMTALSIGIIGGADGPTAIFVTSAVPPALIAGIAAAVGIALFIVIVKNRKK